MCIFAKIDGLSGANPDEPYRTIVQRRIFNGPQRDEEQPTATLHLRDLTVDDDDLEYALTMIAEDDYSQTIIFKGIAPDVSIPTGS